MAKHVKKKLLDMTVGDPALVFEQVLDYAFEESKQSFNEYITNELGYETSKPLFDAIEDMAPWFVQRGFLQKDQVSDVVERILIAAGGTSGAFDFVMRMLWEDCQKRTKKHPDFKPAILIPTPTYGFFYNMADQWGIHIETIAIDIENDGIVCADAVRRSFESLHDKGYHVVAFYDCNPHNPTGCIRDQQRTQEIANIIMRMNLSYREQDAKRHTSWDGVTSDILVIDDLVYDGTEYEGENAAFSFSQIPEIADQTILLLGLSKIGLAGLRAGVSIAPLHINKELRRIQKNNTYFASRPAILAAKAFFNTQEPFVSWRRNYLKGLAHTHQRAGLLMKALINGVDAMDELSDEQRTDLIERVCLLKDVDQKRAQEILNDPLPYIRIATTPQSGFFHLLDLRQLEGRTHKNLKEYVSEDYYGIHKEDDARGIIWSQHQLMIVPSEWAASLHDNKYFCRITYAVSDDVIFDVVDRLRSFCECIKLSEDRPKALYLSDSD